ncbi:MAG: hypothetical protein HQK49_16910 [Oligoflexia bacterium]|nr:hypothetical protein [Oligoflexia bacterium]
MKNLILTPIILNSLIIIATLFSISSSAHSTTINSKQNSEQTYNNLLALLDKIKAAETNKLPKTAIELAKELEKKAKAENENGLYIRALAKKIINQSLIEGNQPKNRIKHLLKNLKDQPTQFQPILKTILALWFTEYYQQNSYRFRNRTALEKEASNEDFLSWDLSRIQSEIEMLLTDALKEKEYLKKIPIGKYRGLIENSMESSSSKSYSLYEFLLRESINFYTNFFTTTTKDEEQEELLSSSPAFSNYTKFINVDKKNFSNISSSYKNALLCYQDLLKFYYDDKSKKEMLLDSELWRLSFLKEKGVGDDKLDIIKTHLQSLITEFSKFQYKEIAEAYYLLSQIYNEEGDLLKAVNICKELPIKFSDSNGAKLCKNQISTITQKAFNADIEHTIDQFNQKLYLRYKNISEIHIKIVKDTWENYLEDRWSSLGEYANPKQISSLLELKADAQWSVKLAPTKDYQFKSETIELPKLAYGFYHIFISEKSDFPFENNGSNNQLIHNSFWYTDTTLLLKTDHQKIQGLIVDSRNGKPLTDRIITIFKRDNDKEGKYFIFKKISSDSNGSFTFNENLSGDFSLAIDSNNTGAIAYQRAINIYSSNNSNTLNTKDTKPQAIIYTDRSIYRPGQRIQFKVICIEVNSKREKDSYQINKCQNVNITLTDQNGREISKTTKSANEWGSFSGDFLIPNNILNGQMYISSNWPNGQASIQVEEYKRPKFEVNLKPSQKEFALKKIVEAEGSAISYNGIPIANAKVKFRVTRNTHYPILFHRWFSGQPFLPQTANKEIAHGEIMTDNKGNFKVEFLAAPDLQIDKNFKPFFNFNLDIQVVDNNGESRGTNRSYTFAYNSIKAEMLLPEWIQHKQDSTLKITTKNFDNHPVSNNGKITIHLLDYPSSPQRKESMLHHFIWNQSSRFNKVKELMESDLSDIKNWKIAKEVFNSLYQTNEETGTTNISLNLSAGAYRAILKTVDKYNNDTQEELNFIVIPNNNESFNIPVPSIMKVKNTTVNVGESLEAFWASGYTNPDVQAYVTIIKNSQILKSYWTNHNRDNSNSNSHFIIFDVNEKHLGGFTLQVHFVHQNQLYVHTQFINVPRKSKDLQLKWESFRSKIKPNENQTWSLKITGANAGPASSELLATLYDQSLDSIKSHSFSDFKFLFENDVVAPEFNSTLYKKDLQILYNLYHLNLLSIPPKIYPYFTEEIRREFSTLFPFQKRFSYMAKSLRSNSNHSKMINADSSSALALTAASPSAPGYNLETEAKVVSTTNTNNTNNLNIRKNLNESAFFYPHLVSDQDGLVKISFQAPQALTKWKFMGLAHGKQLESGLLVDEINTQKELMITTNAPRFIRMGDKIYFNVKVSNTSDSIQKGEIYLKFFNTLTDKEITDLLIKNSKTYPFELAANESKSFSFEIDVDSSSIDLSYPLTYRFVATSATFSDGEESLITILPRSIFVQESFPLWINGPGNKEFNWNKLSKHSSGQTIKHHKLIVQMVSNPIWYAILALPYLEEENSESSDQLFNRFYANTLGELIINSNPSIEKILKSNISLKSNLQKNQISNLNSTSLEETPWYADANNEEILKQKIAIFFDKNRIHMESKTALDELIKQMLPATENGGWPWFKGGPRNDYITKYILSGIGKLKKIGIKIDITPFLTTIKSLDSSISEQYKIIKNKKLTNENNYNSTIALYLYTRSFFLKELPINNTSNEHKEYKEALNYFLDQANKHWISLNSKMSEAHTALALSRMQKESKTPMSIIKSLRERSTHSNELGVYWEENALSYLWFHAPIETHAMMIELFNELAPDQKEIDLLKLWAIKQKQTHMWKSNKATSEIIWNLLNSNSNSSLLKQTSLVEISLGNTKIVPPTNSIEAGSGFYQKSFDEKEILSNLNSNLGHIKLTKSDSGPSWGGVFWHYFEDISKITPHKTPLVLSKKIFVKKLSKKGPLLSNKLKLQVGDTLIVRINLQVDRDMEFVEMKDMRASGTEPLNQISKYKTQDNLSYYQSTKDYATYFYFDHLSKGNYVFEYELKIFQKGVYQTGITEIKSLYAPEFSSHSESILLEVR